MLGGRPFWCNLPADVKSAGAWVFGGRLHEPDTATVGAQIAAKAGSILARLHGLALQPERRLESWHTPLKSEDEWMDLADQASAHGMMWASALRRALPNVVDLLGIAADVTPPAAMLCHCALAPANVRVARDGRLAVLGWEHAGAMPRRPRKIYTAAMRVPTCLGPAVSWYALSRPETHSG